jgi:hypothetical protein
MTMEHPDYSILAARIAVSNLHKMTKKVGNPCFQNRHTSARFWKWRQSKFPPLHEIADIGLCRGSASRM